MAVSPQTLASYVPALVARQFAASPDPLTAPTSQRFPAAVLFADVAGYTAMAVSLAQRGPAGAEDLIRLLNAYFGQLIDIVINHGGDIIKFAGDAALILWPALDESLPVVTQRAAQCGLELQQVLGQYPVAEGLRLSLRVGIGAGEVLTASVGGEFRRWEFLVAGAPLAQMSAAQRQAQPGQVVLSPEAWTLVREQCSGASLLGPSDEDAYVLLQAIREPLHLRRLPPVTPAPGSEVALRGYIPGAILSRLDAGQTEWLSELRRVTVVFLNVTGLNYAAPNAVEQAQAVMQGLQKALYRYEGSVNQFIVDDKGTTLVAAFGLPPYTHEDDAVRGIQAALAMHERLQSLGLQSAIGVTTGQVYCGERGNAQRREYAMVGNVVNMAARLMQAAAKYKGSSIPILCDEATCQAAQARLVFDELPPITVKGRTEPIAVYRPRGQIRAEGVLSTAAGQSRTEMIGRTAERMMLLERLQALLRGDTTSIVVIEGEAGIGKTRLVEEIVAQARGLNVRSLIGAGDAVEKSTSYHAWRSILSQMFGLTGLGSVEARRERLQAQLQSSPGLLRLMPLLNAVLPLELPDNETTAQMEGEARADNTRDLLLRLLQTTASSSPTLLVLEDAYWMDPFSWRLALAAGQQVRPLLLIIVTRPLPDEYRQLLSLMPGMQWLRLEALSPQDTMTLVCQRLNVPALPTPVATLIYEKAQGNPFFSKELALALLEAGLIVITDGECQLGPAAANLDTVSADSQQLLNAIGLPDTVQGIITSRIDRLLPAQQLALKIASVIGRTFSARLLYDIYPIQADKAMLPNHLATLQQLDLTQLESDGADPIYAFKSAMIQETAYNLMLFAQRRQLHRASAEWFERTYADDLPPFYPLLAYHWSRAAEGQQPDPLLVSKAIDYLEKAGEQALRNYANQEAMRFFNEALALEQPAAQTSSSTARRARWERELGEACLNLGRLPESREHLERAVALMERPVPNNRLRLISSLTGQIVMQAIYRLWGAPPCHRPAGGEHLLEAARAYWALGQVYFYANETLLNVYANLRSLNLAQQAGPSPELARSYASVCIAAGLMRRHRLAQAYSRWARQIAQQVNHLPSLAWVLLVTAAYDAGVGNWLPAREALGRAIEISNRLGDRRRWEQSLNTLATVGSMQGDLLGMASLFDSLYESAQRRGDVQYQVYGLLGRARCLLLTGDPQALALLEKVETLLTRNVGRLEEIYGYGILALAHLRHGPTHQAQQAADRAARLILQSRPISYNLMWAYTSVAEVYLTLWEQTQTSATQLDADRLSNQARQACQALATFADVFPIAQPSAWICRGLYEHLSAQPTHARALWRKGLATAERLEMPYEQGWAHYELGRRATGAEREYHLARAQEIFGRLGVRRNG